MPTLREIAAELGISEDVLTAKADVVKKWDGIFAASDTAVSDAQRKLQEAQDLQRVVDDNIRSFGMTEANVAQLQASNAAYKAALEEVQKQGFSGLKIPELPSINPTSKDPMDALKDLIVGGFTNMGQALAVSNRYQRVFGKPMPDDPSAFADKAAKARMSVEQYAEQTYGFTKAESEAAAAASLKQQEEWKAAGAKEYAEKHPAPQFGEQGGLPSKFPAMPPPRDTKSVREFAGMTAREKITSAMNRANEAAKSMSAA